MLPDRIGSGLRRPVTSPDERELLKIFFLLGERAARRARVPAAMASAVRWRHG